MNQDLALIYNTVGTFEKVASADTRRPTLADLAMDLVTDGDEDVDLEKAAQVHEMLIEADMAGRARAQQEYSELETAALGGDADALGTLSAYLDGPGDSSPKAKLAAALRR